MRYCAHPTNMFHDPLLMDHDFSAETYQQIENPTQNDDIKWAPPLKIKGG